MRAVTTITLAVLLGLSATAWAQPPQSGTPEVQGEAPPPPWRVPDYPILAMAPTGSGIVLDGKVDLDGEWKDAVIVSGLLQRDMAGIAPHQAQVTLAIKTDGNNLYIGVRTPVFPAGTELRSFEKVHDRADGVMSGDHLALELLPVKSRSVATLRSTGSFTLLWNTLNTVCDFHVNSKPGMDGLEWISNAEVRSEVSDTCWQSELKLPLASMAAGPMKRYLSLPPADGDYWSLGFARRFGSEGRNLFTSWDLGDLVYRIGGFEDQISAWRAKPMIRFDSQAVLTRLKGLGRLSEGELDANLSFYNPTTEEHAVTVALFLQDADGKKLWAEEKFVKVPPGKTVPGPALRCRPELPNFAFESLKEHSVPPHLYLKITQDKDKLLYITPGEAVIKFDELTRKQYERSLQMLRKL